MPLTYMFGYYTSYSNYNMDIINSTKLNLNYLTDYQTSNKFSTILPMGTRLLSNFNQNRLNKYLN